MFSISASSRDSASSRARTSAGIARVQRAGRRASAVRPRRSGEGAAGARSDKDGLEDAAARLGTPRAARAAASMMLARLARIRRDQLERELRGTPRRTVGVRRDGQDRRQPPSHAPGAAVAGARATEGPGVGSAACVHRRATLKCSADAGGHLACASARRTRRHPRSGDRGGSPGGRSSGPRRGGCCGGSPCRRRASGSARGPRARRRGRGAYGNRASSAACRRPSGSGQLDAAPGRSSRAARRGPRGRNTRSGRAR